MKYLPLRDFEDITSALNFETPDCHVVGGCDLYTTKAAGSDKKLYKNIEQSLESQHESLLKLSASLSLPQSQSLAASMNLSRSSPFGPLSQISSRRTFAYLIATLNASHPDYDFSHVLRPSDFRKERSLRSVMSVIDTTLYNLRPRRSGALLAIPDKLSSLSGAVVPSTPGGSQVWGPRMWRLMDNEMNLRECSIYCYVPEEDPFDGEDSALWSLNYFFFNKNRKRVCYVYVRGLSVINHSPMLSASGTSMKRSRPKRAGSAGLGASKRAVYWLGDRANNENLESAWGDEDDEDAFIVDPGDDEVDADEEFDIRDEIAQRYLSDDDDDDYDDNVYHSAYGTPREREKSTVRAVSEQIADMMEGLDAGVAAGESGYDGENCA